eukprot:GSMAST32.ASY1.ANO1.2400.1 assembled CDS
MPPKAINQISIPDIEPKVSGKVSKKNRDFEWSYTDEPHASRRKAIMAKYPQVKKLFGHDTNTKWKDMSWLSLFLCAYCIGGTINHAMTLAMHEISHGLAFRKMVYNKLFGMVANLPLGIPASASFKRYHADHHRHQGLDVIDADVPTDWEVSFFVGPLKKVLWMLLQPAFYALRPLWEAINWTMQIAFNCSIYYLAGSKGVVYLVAGTLLGMGIHPMAGHFVAEHYTFIKGQETYSYYGPLNVFSFNVGYHNEHHDFPFIPGSRLPTLRAMAPEFYDTLPYHDSWCAVIWQYITDPEIGPWSRIKRKQTDCPLKLD